MRFHTPPDLKWIILAVFITTFLLKIYLTPTDNVGLSILGISLISVIAALIWSFTSLPEPTVYWDERKGIFAIFRFWSIEVNSARLLASVPIGIDLSHSAKKVLQAMYTRFQNESGGELVFFIIRPLGNQSTKIGFLVRRRGLRLWNGIKHVEDLSKQLGTDIAILERVMRAAYPHLPVTTASLQDIVKATTGGLETHAFV
ncbi:hypothetical protein EU527_02490 [Candidatus Thorarchaeota archaeon]|nr:MAG: hypothetical protein EU527_02490 [Candidatus Thorarchaeota archaeon]